MYKSTAVSASDLFYNLTHANASPIPCGQIGNAEEKLVHRITSKI